MNKPFFPQRFRIFLIKIVFIPVVTLDAYKLFYKLRCLYFIWGRPPSSVWCWEVLKKVWWLVSLYVSFHILQLWTVIHSRALLIRIQFHHGFLFPDNYSTKKKALDRQAWQYTFDTISGTGTVRFNLLITKMVQNLSLIFFSNHRGLRLTEEESRLFKSLPVPIVVRT